MLHLEESIKLLSDNFPNNWWENFNFHQEREKVPNLDDDINRFINLIRQTQSKLFNDINLSILKGEYVIQSKTLDSISEIELKLNSIRPPNFIPPDADVSALIYTNEFITDFTYPLNLAFGFYKEFVSIVISKLSISNKEFIRYYDASLRAIKENKCSSKAINDLNLLQVNIKIAECDHLLAVEGEMLDFLIESSIRLDNELNIAPYSLDVKRKCDFLKNKLFLRKLHEKYRLHEESKTPIYTIINGIEKPIATKEFQDGFIDSWLDYLDNHYEINDNWKYNFEYYYKGLASIDFSNCLVLDLCKLIKYNKDIIKTFPVNTESIKKIRNELKVRLSNANKEESLFNIYAYKVALNYSINNEFSSVCENPTTDIQTAQKMYNEVLQVQNLTGIKNFFPQTKFLNFLLSKLKAKHYNNKGFDSLEESRKIINICKEIYKTYEENVSWSKLNYNYVFQLPFKECLIDLPNSDVKKLFISSSFVMPLPKQVYMRKFEEEKEEGVSVRIYNFCV